MKKSFLITLIFIFIVCLQSFFFAHTAQKIKKEELTLDNIERVKFIKKLIQSSDFLKGNAQYQKNIEEFNKTNKETYCNLLNGSIEEWESMDKMEKLLFFILKNDNFNQDGIFLSKKVNFFYKNYLKKVLGKDDFKQFTTQEKKFANVLNQALQMQYANFQNSNYIPLIKENYLDIEYYQKINIEELQIEYMNRDKISQKNKLYMLFLARGNAIN